MARPVGQHASACVRSVPYDQGERPVLQLLTQVDDFHVGLLLWDNENGELLASAFEPGLSNSIRMVLPVGVYRIGVTALDTLRGRVEYALVVGATGQG